MKILITGINSALGSSIAARLSANKKNEIIGLDLKPNRKFKTISFDLGSGKNIKIPPVDVCLHLAFITDPRYCEKNLREAYKVNVLGTQKILDYCKANIIKKFILISTGGVYGFNKKILKENMKLKPHDAYSYMKMEAEDLSKKYSSFFDVVVLRYFFPYGPGTKSNSLINRLILNIKKGKKIEMNKKGKPEINPIYVSDLVNATCMFCYKKINGFNVFNIAGKEKATIGEICLIISKLSTIRPIFEETGKNIGDMVASISKLSKFYKPKVKLREGLKRTIGYINKN